MYFSYDPEDCFEFHDTEEEARERAERALETECEAAYWEEWNENTTDICYGKVIGQVIKTGRREATEDDCTMCDEIWDFKLKKVEGLVK